MAKPCPGVPRRPKYARAIQQLQAGQELTRSAIRKDARYQSGFTAAAAGRRTEGFDAGTLSDAPRKLGPAHPDYRRGLPLGVPGGGPARGDAGQGPGPPPGPQPGAQPGPVQGDIRRLLGLRPAGVGQPVPGQAGVPAGGPGAPPRRRRGPPRAGPAQGQAGGSQRLPGRVRRGGGGAPPDPAQRDIRALLGRGAEAPAPPPMGVGSAQGADPPAAGLVRGPGFAACSGPARGNAGVGPSGRRAASAPPRAGGPARGSEVGSRVPGAEGFFQQPPPAFFVGNELARAGTDRGPAAGAAGSGRPTVLDMFGAVMPRELD